jgi:D-lactate dehydrogenase
MMGGDIMALFSSVCKKARFEVVLPSDIRGSCCGQVFSSKGFTEAHAITANQTIEKLWGWSEQGKLPIVVDVTSCTQTIKGYSAVLTRENADRFARMKFLDVIDFAADILPRLNIIRKKEQIVFHPVCSAYKMGLIGSLQKIGNACASKPDIPLFAKCCGMAGDRGFYYPDLTASATRLEADEVKQVNYEGYYSSSTTCEMAMSEAVGRSYESILKLLDDVSE